MSTQNRCCNNCKQTHFAFDQYVLAEQEINLKIKNEAADKLIKIVSAENEIVQKEKLFGMISSSNSLHYTSNTMYLQLPRRRKRCVLLNKMLASKQKYVRLICVWQNHHWLQLKQH